MKDKALSLIELVVSLAITMIISATVLVSFTIIDRRKLETTARNLLADLSWAREMAVARNQNYTVNFYQVNNRSYYNITDESGNLIDSARPVYPIVIAPSPDNLTFLAHQGTIVLSPSINDTICLELSRRRRELTVYNQTGYVNLSKTIIP